MPKMFISAHASALIKLVIWVSDVNPVSTLQCTHALADQKLISVALPDPTPLGGAYSGVSKSCYKLGHLVGPTTSFRELSMSQKIFDFKEYFLV